ncbi:MAG TPA: radical SAM protein [Candidatus Sabulitectum sp.]|nr:radical SAM protein [Candidatus Sabulitectum sp.]HPF33478.1 radical SAM protein [Candidatus Sabulitectum sp.]HPJ27647.1 radical SAM protein [Candidatus Sabulitectum sp.]HPR21377.1 radical SAM protein [Candidatus Sabulitectum sp.]
MRRPIPTSSLLGGCGLCPRLCGADRVSGERGFCGAGAVMEVASAVIHRGEEPFLTGERGVGNVFFNHCSMACVYCQNHQISRRGGGTEHSPESISEILLGFQEQGCPTVGLVSPGHYLPMAAETIQAARNTGLEVPVIWNSNGYETVEPLRLLEGLVDIYLPDLKYLTEESAALYSAAPGYPEAAKAAIEEMYRQTGPLAVNDGIASGGLAVRHLVLPNGLGDTEEVLRFIAGISTEIPVSLMSQYNPVFRAGDHPLLSRRVSPTEYWRAVDMAHDLGLHRTLIQDPESSPDSYLPDFTRKNAFSD